MKKVIHRAGERGEANYGWLKTHYSFSFANWLNPEKMGFGVLRVINDDEISPNSGFPMHGHRDMEIITIVTKGVLSHKDSLGNEGIIKEGEVQVMSAGTGVTHSEFNSSSKEILKLFQIWIEPNKKNVIPRYYQKSLKEIHGGNGLKLIVGPNNSDENLFVYQDAYIYQVLLTKDKTIEYNFRKEGSGAYVFVVEGEIIIEDDKLNMRDAIGISETQKIKINSTMESVVFIFEVPFTN